MKQFYIHISVLAILLSYVFPHSAEAGIFSRKVDSIQIVFDKNQLVLPGESFKIGIISYHKKGKIRKTFGMKGGSVLWWKYKTEVRGGENSSGKINVSKDLIPSKGKYISIKVYPRRQPQLAKTVLIPLNYEIALDFKPKANFDKAPGCSFEGKIAATFNNGRVLVYNIVNSNTTSKNFEINSGGILYDNGRFTIEPDFRNIIDHRVDVWIRSKRNPLLYTNYSILLDYKHKYSLAFRGSSGMSGFNGSDGSRGLINGNGAHGESGYSGQSGEDGTDIGIWVDNYFDSTLTCNLLYVYAENFQSKEEFYYLINPDGGRLNVITEGGNGGRGGDGGNGADGADGQIWYETKTKTRIVKKPFTKTVVKTVTKRRTTGTGKQEEYDVQVTEQITEYRDVTETYQVQVRHQKPGHDGGNGGFGGSGGSGGQGGWGGNIYTYFTFDAMDYENRIIAQSRGGNGGNGGHGGCGGSGSPNGKSGCSGGDGPELIGWANDGQSGELFLNSTEEFFFYGPLASNTYNHQSEK